MRDPVLGFKKTKFVLTYLDQKHDIDICDVMCYIALQDGLDYFDIGTMRPVLSVESYGNFLPIIRDIWVNDTCKEFSDLCNACRAIVGIAYLGGADLVSPSVVGRAKAIDFILDGAEHCFGDAESTLKTLKNLVDRQTKDLGRV